MHGLRASPGPTRAGRPPARRPGPDSRPGLSRSSRRGPSGGGGRRPRAGGRGTSQTPWPGPRRRPGTARCRGSGGPWPSPPPRCPAPHPQTPRSSPQREPALQIPAAAAGTDNTSVPISVVAPRAHPPAPNTIDTFRRRHNRRALFTLSPPPPPHPCCKSKGTAAQIAHTRPRPWRPEAKRGKARADGASLGPGARRTAFDVTSAHRYEK